MVRPLFDDEEKRRELALRLSAIEGVTIADSALKKRPSFRLSLLSGSSGMDKFLGAFDWMLSEIKNVENKEYSDQP